MKRVSFPGAGRRDQQNPARPPQPRPGRRGRSAVRPRPGARHVNTRLACSLQVSRTRRPLREPCKRPPACTSRPAAHGPQDITFQNRPPQHRRLAERCARRQRARVGSHVERPRTAKRRHLPRAAKRRHLRGRGLAARQHAGRARAIGLRRGSGGGAHRVRRGSGARGGRGRGRGRRGGRGGRAGPGGCDARGRGQRGGRAAAAVAGGDGAAPGRLWAQRLWAQRHAWDRPRLLCRRVLLSLLSLTPRPPEPQRCVRPAPQQSPSSRLAPPRLHVPMGGLTARARGGRRAGAVSAHVRALAPRARPRSPQDGLPGVCGARPPPAARRPPPAARRPAPCTFFVRKDPARAGAPRVEDLSLSLFPPLPPPPPPFLCFSPAAAYVCECARASGAALRRVGARFFGRRCSSTTRW
jgi:hypothetical protein